MILAAKPKSISRQGRCRDDQLPPSFEPYHSNTLRKNLSHSNTPLVGAPLTLPGNTVLTFPKMNRPGPAHIEGYGWAGKTRTRPRAN